MLFSENEAWEGQKGMKQEQSSSEQVIGSANKMNRVLSQPATAPAVVQDVEEEDVVVEEVRNGVQQNSASK